MASAPYGVRLLIGAAVTAIEETRKFPGFLERGHRRTYQQTDPIRCTSHGLKPALTAGLVKARGATTGCPMSSARTLVAMPPTINMGIPGATSSVAQPVVGKRVLLAEPRGYCAGVDRAVETVERALEKHGAPVYVRHEIVHNRHVVDTLAKAGAVFVDETDEVPEGAIVVFSAHGVAPTVHDQAAERKLQVIDATCPLVTKVHNEAKRFARDDYDILLDRPRGPRRGRRHRGRGARPRAAGRRPGRGRRGHRPRREQGHLAVADHAERRRDDGDRAAAARALPEAAGSAQRRHLLRHPEPPGRGQGDGARMRAGDRRRLAQLVELGPAGRGGAGRRLRTPPTWSTTPTTSTRPGWTV